MESSAYTNKILGVILILAVVAFAGLVSKDFIVDKIADRVVLKLQKSYSPSPYGPGLDPDKIDAEAIKDRWN